MEFLTAKLSTESNEKVDQLVRNFLAQAHDRGVSTEYLCDSQLAKFEERLRLAFKKLLSASQANPA
jgi:hypothetical protein